MVLQSQPQIKLSPNSKLPKACHVLIPSNASIAKANTWPTTTSVPSGETDSTEIGTQKKHKKPRKPRPIQFT